MNILCINHEFPPIGGGGATACYFLTRELKEAGNSFTIVTSAFSDLPLEEQINGGRVIRVKALRRKREKSTFPEMLSFLVSAFFTVKKLLKKEKFDICFTFFGIPSGPLAWYIKRRYRIPYIIRMGGGDIPGAQNRFKLLYKLLSNPLKRIWEESEGVVANSEGLQEKARKFHDCKKLQVITNGVDSQYFCRQSAEKREGIELLFVSRLLEGKGLQYIIPELEMIQQKASVPIHLSIVGDGPYREELIRLTRAYHMEEIISFEGLQNRESLLAYYSRADIFILPSKSEGMPNVVLEAMSMGLPIVMTPCQGSKELVTDNGIIADYKHFAQAIIKLCKDPELRRQMGEKSRKNVEKSFQWKQIARQYEKLLKQAVKKG
ncbi:MAG: glycosyltransferase family 4 protein [Lachnospiraceae bacterium]|nr:glycosyltransferase family 4 protein [Lachnospiraceae bacterium]